MEEYIKKAPMYAFKNKEAVEASQICGCYNCLQIINVSDIEFWTDEETLKKIRNHWFNK